MANTEMTNSKASSASSQPAAVNIRKVLVCVNLESSVAIDYALELAKVPGMHFELLHGGGGFDVQSWIDRVPALLHAWFPGQYGGQALAEILFGAINPSGKLPITMEKHAQDNPASASFPTDLNASTINYSEGLFVGYRGYENNHIQPQYPFGYGLSYTTFSYSYIDINPLILKKEDQDQHGLTKADWKKQEGDDDKPIRASFRVTNTGKRPGAEIAQLYVAPVNPPITRPMKELKGFKKVFLQPGESKKVTITLDRRSLAYYDVSAHAWDVARGVYRILVGSSSQDIGLQGAVLNLFPAQLSVLKSTRVMCSNRDRNKQKLLHRALEAFHKRQPGQCWMNQLPIPAVPEIQLEQT